MPIRREVMRAGFGRRMHTISTRREGQDVESASAFVHRHGSNTIALKEDHSKGRKIFLHRKDDILRLRNFLDSVCEERGWNSQE